MSTKEDCYVELPIDANGKHIHILDHIENDNGRRIHVHALILQDGRWLACEYGLISPFDMTVDDLDKWHVVMPENTEEAI